MPTSVHPEQAVCSSQFSAVIPCNKGNSESSANIYLAKTKNRHFWGELWARSTEGFLFVFWGFFVVVVLKHFGSATCLKNICMQLLLYMLKTVRVELGEYLNLSHTKGITRIAIYNILQIVGWQWMLLLSIPAVMHNMVINGIISQTTRLGCCSRT